ncbi:MAG TPA: diacylglycerol kinase family protein [Flavitalea sp.]|nr:diacylglycerol kinase family protein [Flavitalea sp.]
MKNASIFHNPNAGKQQHTKKKLISLVKSHGFGCGYSSTKSLGWTKIKPETDFIVVAGGDGTVKKVVVKLFHKKKKKRHLPILLLPLGTANNIAKSLGIEGNIESLIKNLDKANLKKFDVGIVTGSKKKLIFLESFGFGIFPELMKKMEKIPENEDATPEENIITALKQLHKIVMHYPASLYTIVIDGVSNTDHYLLIEVMNVPSIGPRLTLSPDADPGDGEMELILIPESQRQELADHISDKIKGVETQFIPIVIKGKNISMAIPAGLIHLDDQLKMQKKTKKLNIIPEPGMIQFFVQ